MLTKKTKYALKALTCFARTGSSPLIQAPALANAERIPRKFLELILLELKNHGLLESRQGKGGGYRLAKPASVITMGQVMRLMQGPLALTPCVSQTAYEKCEECLDENQCGMRLVMKDVREATAAILDATTLEDLLRKESGASPD